MWLSLDGAVNVRDLGGLALLGGGVVRPRRLLRADNLQGLTAADVRLLVDQVGVTDVVDLRTAAERSLEGTAPLDRHPAVTVHHQSLLPEHGDEVREVNGNLLLPWQRADDAAEEVPVERSEAASVYVRYLHDRPDSIVASLAAIGRADGAVVVHCAAGKDRTGVIVALALELAGVGRDAIRADFMLTGDRIDAILDRLRATPTYAANLRGRPRETHLPRAAALDAVFSTLDDAGGTESWLSGHGWRSEDSAALRARLRNGSPSAS